MDNNIAPLEELPKVSPPDSEQVQYQLKNFKGIRNPVLLGTFRTLPWLILLVALIREDLDSLDYMAVTRDFAAILAFLAILYLLNLIPRTLDTLWSRGMIHAKTDVRHAEEEPEKTGDERLFLNYLKDLENWLNDPRGQWIAAIAFTILAIFTLPPRLRGGDKLIAVLQAGDFASIGLAALQLLAGAIIGIMVWWMVITGVFVWKLGQDFDLEPRWGHPDHAGGFEPLGNLCLWNALIISIPSLYLGVWIAIGPSFPQFTINWTPLLAWLTLIPVILALTSFFLPLWSIHLAMVEKREKVQERLNQLSRSIHELELELLHGADRLDPSEVEKKTNRLELMREIYQKNLHHPVWPFNTKIISQLIGSQTVPLLSAFGLGEPVVKLIAELVSFLVNLANSN